MVLTRWRKCLELADDGGGKQGLVADAGRMAGGGFEVLQPSRLDLSAPEDYQMAVDEASTPGHTPAASVGFNPLVVCMRLRARMRRLPVAPCTQ